ncbi:MAG: phage holin family protein [Kibdelosporangium sp.]
MDAGWAGLIVAVVWAAIGAVPYPSGRRQLREVDPVPEQTAAGNVTEPAQDAKSAVQQHSSRNSD